MAVTAPTPPTPPTAPVVPKVTMSDGGSVTLSDQPVSGHHSAEQLQENQARQAVARGDGALAKTTQEKPPKANSEPTAAKPAEPTAATNTEVAKTNASKEGNENAATANTNETQSTQAQIPPSPQYHDGFYWLGIVVVAVVVAATAWHYFNKARSNDARISFSDINDDSEVVNNSYNGMTAAEAMQQLAADEAKQDQSPAKTAKPEKHFEVSI